MAIAADWLAQHFNRPGFELFDYDVFALCGDGCMMEGVGSEAASLAGHLRLGNLCWIYDSNHITIEGNTELAFSEDVGRRAFSPMAGRCSGSATPTTASGSADAIADRQADRRPADPDHRRQPYRLWRAAQAGHLGAPMASRLAKKKSKLTKRSYGWPEDAKFLVPDGVYEHFAAEFRRPRQKASRRMDRAVRALPGRISRSRRCAASACSGASCPRAGTATSRSSRPTQRASPAAIPRRRC